MDRNDIRRWDSVAQRYADWLSGADGPDGKEVTEMVTSAVLEVIGDVSGSRVLDLGCGEGHLARTLARMGAVVDGVDGSAGMIAIARRASAGLAVAFRQSDIRTVLPYPERNFDVAVYNMVLMDVDQVADVVRQAERVLKENGRFVFSITHPCFSAHILGRQESSGEQQGCRPRRRYTVPVRWTKNPFGGMAPSATVTHYHRPIGYHVRAVLAAGLAICVFVETSMPEPSAHPDLHRFYLTAHSLIIAARK
ncbi:class I SAM-dependent methyltransferase [Streptantibioticus cattleyicolor]|uniref:Methylase n=1 Tax=Streptantibioticus cattleyicolor (strain ATCC 35852 / DSM 46488 / JCM 4925 / NBRC 14057 / NRRL 8057) TaxID=1003195 RepID=G8XHN0_STREN|nr:class I SAM-dependent methyltransferase [Streptantibioticus cattleyicolor]AEW99867.1 methylase [Streptantibioticus cattleyicolor NRRL 8057 = DSM 46488]